MTRLAAAMFALILPISSAMAFEGMYLPEQVPEMGEVLGEMGLELDPATLADPLTAPLGAVASLGFCTASFVSPDGLMVTNHHCVDGYLRVASDAEHNYALDGYTAASRDQELPAGAAARVWVVQEITDVTEAVLLGVRDGRRATPRKDRARRDRIEANRKALVKDCEGGDPAVSCRIASMYGGVTYRMLRSIELQDVRIVHAPPEGVGNYGGDVDNWMWPRHTGDFAVLRAYVAPDGSSAGYAEENVPYTPAHTLELGTDGVGDGDFVMVAGFPGRTQRMRLAMELAAVVEDGPRDMAESQEVIDLFARHMEQSEEAAAKLQAPVGWIGNGMKNRQGLVDMVGRSGMVDAMAQREAELEAWIAADAARARRYGPALDELRLELARQRAVERRDDLYRYLTRYIDYLSVATRAYRFSLEQAKPDAEREAGFQERDERRMRDSFEQLDRTMYLPADLDLLRIYLTRAQALPEDLRVEPIDSWLTAAGSIDEAVEALAGQQGLADVEARLALLDQPPSQLEASTDGWVRLAVALEQWRAPIRETERTSAGTLSRVRPRVAEAMIELDAERRASGTDTRLRADGEPSMESLPRYPDANGTLRLTFGTVRGYSPADAVDYRPFTTVAGMAAKATGEAPFDAPEAVLARVPDSVESPYADPELGDVPVAFLSTLDITGGNSGSPVLDGKGRLVGLAFDGNWESIASDWVFLDDVTRCISVDLRYMLWLLEGDADAGWLLDELGVR